ncbi:hypothetical protein L3476_16715 [Paenibacillus thiaminolyticus]|uniref:hypothetical protein n=1 Tax=Paenibacillus thiaminolyticus TaxID=49283 RepID=UPI0023500805|nr:hypothetical protein [Paenibacillus thiaminolyticus]WCR30169.1 hypothetical protein L3476_16715 [Paenibacillus thiaminolyticus]
MIFTNPYYGKAFENIILISLLSSLAGIAAAVFAAYAITRFPKPVQEHVLVITNLTSNFAGIPLAFAFIVMIGNSALFTLLFRQFGIGMAGAFNLHSWSGLTVIYVYFQLPLATALYPASC